MIKDLIDSAVFIESLEAQTKDAVFDEILAAVVASGKLAKRHVGAVARRLREREELGTTGIGKGVAVPHVKGKEVEQTCLILARSPQGIEYEAIDGLPVHIVFMIMAPPDQAEEHLQALRWISGLARNSDFRRFAMQARGEADLRDLLEEMSAGN